MKLWLISQGANNGYDTYDSAVVAAETKQQAKETSPSGYYVWKKDGWYFQYDDGTERNEGKTVYHWTDPSQVDVRLIGNAVKGTEAGVICASFNAG